MAEAIALLMLAIAFILFAVALIWLYGELTSEASEVQLYLEETTTPAVERRRGATDQPAH